MLDRDPALFAQLMLHAWSAVETPEMLIPQSLWIRWFRRVGFVSDDGTACPTEPRALYRGCRQRYARRMSWTTDIEIARFFAQDDNPHYGRTGGPGVILEARVSPRRILAIVHNARKENEVIIDPTRLHYRKLPEQ